tara:strand:- start:87449 stop:87892 length:444 start_codon:yes stop_codon:yes gene_type:complete
MAKNFAEIAFADAVKKLQEKHGSRKSYERMEKFSVVDGLTDGEILFIQNRDSFYLATIGVTNAIRSNSEVPNEKLKALSIFSRQMTVKIGLPSEDDINNFLSAGYTEENILGVIAGLGVKTMSNYFNHVYKTPVDEAFSSRVWTKPN